MGQIIYKDLSYILNGIFFEVYNHLGSGYKEKYYCEAIIHKLKENKINFVYQFKAPLMFYDKVIGKRYFDFLIENKIIVEMKVKNRPAKKTSIKFLNI